MKKFIRRLGAALIPATAALALAALVPAFAGPPTTSPPRQDTGTGTISCGDPGDGNASNVTWSPTTLWPPNHALIPITISHTDTADNDGVAIHVHVNSISSSQGSASTGVGNTGDGVEIKKAAVTIVGVTAERDGGDKKGNVYTINVSCIEDEPFAEERTSVNLTVTVPHD